MWRKRNAPCPSVYLSSIVSINLNRDIERQLIQIKLTENHLFVHRCSLCCSMVCLLSCSFFSLGETLVLLFVFVRLFSTSTSVRLIDRISLIQITSLDTLKLYSQSKPVGRQPIDVSSIVSLAFKRDCSLPVEL